MRKKANAIERREELYRQLESGELEFEDAIRLIRRTLGITQLQFAQMANVDVRVLRNFERRQGNLHQSTIEKILKPLGLKLTARRYRPQF